MQSLFDSDCFEMLSSAVDDYRLSIQAKEVTSRRACLIRSMSADGVYAIKEALKQADDYINYMSQQNEKEYKFQIVYHASPKGSVYHFEIDGIDEVENNALLDECIKVVKENLENNQGLLVEEQ